MSVLFLKLESLFYLLVIISVSIVLAIALQH